MTGRLHLTPKEHEAVLWGIAQMSDYPDREIVGPTDPLHVLTNEGFSRTDITAACIAMEDMLSETQFLLLPLDPIEQGILRQCVETTTWLDAYLVEPVNLSGRREAHDTLVTFADKLDEVGIHINYIPELEGDQI